MSPRSISAPTIAGCWWRGRRAADFVSSTRSRASSGSARGWPRPARCPRRRWRAPWMRSRSAPARSPTAASPSGRYVATEACRRAANCEAFLARVRDEVGPRNRDHLDRRGGAPCRLRLRAAARSAHSLRDRLRHRRRLDRDRLAAPRPTRRDRRRWRPQILGSVSLPLGVVTLTDRFGGEVSPTAYRTMVDEAACGLAAVRARPPHPAARPRPAGCRCWAARAR